MCLFEMDACLAGKSRCGVLEAEQGRHATWPVNNISSTAVLHFLAASLT